jgi:DNA invertase Pin-like site-specific DNA recombinase
MDVLGRVRIDRLARSIGDLQDIVRTVRAKGATLKATEQPIDTSTAAGKCFLDMLGVFAEFETNLRRERQLEGIAKAKAAGVYKGRAASIDEARCLIPGFDGAPLSPDSKDALWDRFFTAAPQRQRRSVERYSIVKRA